MQQAVLSEEILTRFRSLSLERIERVEGGWQTLFEGSDDPALANELRRDLHTLKGDSHVVGFGEVNLLCHRLEDIFSFAHGHDFDVPESIDLMMTMGLRFMAMLLLGKPGAPVAGIDLPGFISELESVLTDAQATAESAPDSFRRTRAAGSVERSDRLSDESRELLGATASRLFVEHLNAVGVSRDRLQEAWTSLRRFISSVSAVPLEPRIAKHARATTELGRSLNKDVWVGVALGQVHVSPEVADALDVAILHLLRNAVDHGIEDAEGRVRARKSPTATLRIAAVDRDDVTEITITDDGRGIDWERVRQVAVERHLLSEAGAARQTQAELCELLFSPGFSTAKAVTDVSGRGIGLDAVRAALKQRGGTIEIRSAPGMGTTAVVCVPRPYPRVSVHRFAVSGSPVPFAVTARWNASVEAKSPTVHRPFEVLDELGIRPIAYEAGQGRVLRLERGATQICLAMTGRLQACSAERICPTGPNELAEVVMIDGTDCLLLRPELLVPDGFRVRQGPSRKEAGR